MKKELCSAVMTSIEVLPQVPGTQLQQCKSMSQQIQQKESIEQVYDLIITGEPEYLRALENWDECPFIFVIATEHNDCEVVRQYGDWSSTHNIHWMLKEDFEFFKSLFLNI